MFFYLITPMHFLHKCIINWLKKLTIKSWIMSLLNKEPVKRVEMLLKQFDKNQKVIILENSARTALDASSSLGCEVGAIVKSLLFKAGDRFILSLVAGDNRCSLNKLKKILNEKDVSMAFPEDVKDNTGYTIGGVSPVGHLKKCDIYVDKSLERFSDIFGAAGHPNAVFKINYNDLLKMTKGLPKDIVEWENQN